MINSITRSLCTLLLLTWTSAPGAAGDHADLLVANATIVSPVQLQAVPAQWVWIRDGRIKRVADSRITVPAGTTRVDAAGRYLVPGIMDSHVHVSVSPGLPPGSNKPAVGVLADAYRKQQGRSYLYFGVTQVLDLAGFDDGIAAFEAQAEKPDLYRCGAAPVLDGYPTHFEGQGIIRPNTIIETARPEDIPAGIDPARHTPEAVVARIAASGARCVKVFIENGFGDADNLPILSTAALARVRAAAHKAGLLLVAHANALDMQKIAVLAEVDVIAHGLWNWGAYHGQAAVPAEMAALLAGIHAGGIGYQPTLRVIAGLRALFMGDTLDDPQLKKVVPTPLLAYYRSPQAQFFKRELIADFGTSREDIILRRFAGVYEQGARVARHLHEIGHPLLLGSDTPSSPTYANQPGYNTYQEIQAMAAAGILPGAILQAATINNARQFGLDTDYGEVSAGKVANLLLLKSNPLESVKAWDTITHVILHGRLSEREAFKVKSQD